MSKVEKIKKFKDRLNKLIDFNIEYYSQQSDLIDPTHDKIRALIQFMDHYSRISRTHKLDSDSDSDEIETKLTEEIIEADNFDDLMNLHTYRREGYTFFDDNSIDPVIYNDDISVLSDSEYDSRKSLFNTEIYTPEEVEELEKVEEEPLFDPEISEVMTGTRQEIFVKNNWKKTINISY